jgi:tRNA threonylcarbamoyladenosine biosynthesis protein TsaE
MDLYRIDDESEFEMAGGRDIMFSSGVSVIEWAEKIAGYFPDNTIKVNIEIEKSGSRKITIDNIKL